MKLKIPKFVVVPLLVAGMLVFSFGDAFAGVCGCSRNVNGITYNVSWYSLTDCRTPNAGLAIVEGLDDKEYLEPYYISIADAVVFCAGA